MMSVALTETAYAKINLALHVRRRREDGYHELETLFAFVDDGDRLTAELADEFSLEIVGPFAEGLSAGDDNLVLRAAMSMRAHFGVSSGARIILDKRLPVAAGLGGGSTDAAATARLLNRLWRLEAEPDALVKAIGGLGADVTACLSDWTRFGRGIGDILEDTPLDGVLHGTPVLLVNPGVPCLTGPVFAGWDGESSGPLTIANALNCRNDLARSAIAIVPEIGEVLTYMASFDCIGAQWGDGQFGMSGSGATCFALFHSAEQVEAVQLILNRDHPGWWTMAGKLR